MSQPTIKSGKLICGEGCTFGEGVMVDVAETVVIGDRCVIGDNTYFGGRRVEIGSDFYGYSHWNRRLEVGLGRRDYEDAVLTVGSRCTCHDNRIDLARRVTIGDDVGLSPEVTIYTHSYWMSPLKGYPYAYAPVVIEDRVIVGFRSTLLAGSYIPNGCVIGACSLVKDRLEERSFLYAGTPVSAKRPLGDRTHLSDYQDEIANQIYDDYVQTLIYRGLPTNWIGFKFPQIQSDTFNIDLVKQRFEGEENEYVDDLRTFLFKRGIRIFSKRKFISLPKRN